MGKKVDESWFESWCDADTHAQNRLPAEIVDSIAGGVEDEVTLARNRQAFLRRAFLPAFLRDMANIDTRTFWG